MIYAEEVNYWKTSRTSPDRWIDKAKREIARAGGNVLGEAFGSESGGRSAYMLAFEFSGEKFKVVWPVLPTKTGNGAAARIQAATMLYHDVKAKAVKAKVFGFRAAFFCYLALPDGRTMSEISAPELIESVPKLLTGGYNA